MWTLFLCIVVASYGVQDVNGYWTTHGATVSTIPGAPCGGYHYDSSGTFHSPNYPFNYPNNANCYWYIRPGRQIVELQFVFADIENHPTCGFDAIYVYDGYSSSSRFLGKMCGKNTTTFYSTGSYLTVRFKSDQIVNLRGFCAHYRTVSGGSCRYNCGYQVGSCSCSSGCEYRGNCCADYADYCPSTTPETTSTPPSSPTSYPSCRYNCGYHMGSCSCSSSCTYYGNCCHDYYYYCSSTPTPTPTASNCGGYLSGSGTFTSPNYPNYYYDNAYCVWQLRADYNQRLYLSISYLQLENCCSCDYINVYDGPTVGSKFLGKVCNNTLDSFFSSSNYLTVLFRTDGSVVGRGFRADFTSTLPTNSGQVKCFSNTMRIVIERSYLDSLGYSADSLYLDDPSCRPQVTRFQVIFSFPITACGNVQKAENGRVVYTNTLRGYTSNYGEITRQSTLKLNVGCRMEQDSVSQIMYLVHHHGNDTIASTGRFNTSMQFYTSSSYHYPVTQFPYEVSLNQNMYVQVDVTGQTKELVLSLDTCVTSPSPHDFHTRAYYLVRNGCPVDSTYNASVTGITNFARFTFKAFQFLRAKESVYIQCKVLICPASDTSRCRQNCRRRVARDLGSEHDSSTLVLGPIQLKADPRQSEEKTPEKEKA